MLVFLFDIRVEHGEIEAGRHRLGRFLLSQGRSRQGNVRTLAIASAVITSSIIIGGYFLDKVLWVAGAHKAQYGTMFPASKEDKIAVSPEYLMELYKDRMSAEGDRLIAPYRGKWMKVTVEVNDIYGPDQVGRRVIYIIGYLLSGTKSRIGLMFDEEWIDRISVIQRGQHLVISGRLSQVSSSGIELGDCEILATESN